MQRACKHMNGPNFGQTRGVCIMVMASTPLPNFMLCETMSVDGGLWYNDQGHPSYCLMEDNAGREEDRSLHFRSLGTHQSSQQIHRRPETLKKGRRRERKRTCVDKEEAEAQRITHILVERNRRRIMNEHLSLLRSLMPDSYAQRGDQASIVGGAVDFVKELEQLHQSLQTHKLILQQGGDRTKSAQYYSKHRKSSSSDDSVEVGVVESHANLRILAKRGPKQLTKLIIGIQALHLCILRLNITTLDQLMILYSISVKLEKGCELKSADDIAGAVHHILILAADEAGPRKKL